MVYQRVSKSSSENSQTHKKDSPSTASAIPIQAKSVSASEQEQEMPSYTPLATNWASNNNLMRSLSENTPTQVEADVKLPASNGGKPMPEAVQHKMEMAFGTDFSDVRIHEGSNAQAIGAIAYTQGSDIHFAPGKHDPMSQSGQELLGHELAHVVQQRLGQVPVPQGKGIPINADPNLEHEADALGAKAAQGESVQVTGASADYQRQNLPEVNKPIQGMFPAQSSSDDLEDRIPLSSATPVGVPVPHANLGMMASSQALSSRGKLLVTAENTLDQPMPSRPDLDQPLLIKPKISHSLNPIFPYERMGMTANSLASSPQRNIPMTEENILDQPIPSELNLEQPLSPQSTIFSSDEDMADK